MTCMFKKFVKKNKLTAKENHEFLKKKTELKFRTIVSEVLSIAGNPLNIKSNLYFSHSLLDFRFDVDIVLNKQQVLNEKH